MNRKAIPSLAVVAAFLSLVVLVACGGGVVANTTLPEAPSPHPGEETGVVAESTAEVPATTVGAAEAEPTSFSGDDGEGTPTADQLAIAVAERTPLPTPASGPVDELIVDITDAIGLTGASFLGLTIPDWLNLMISALIVLIGYPVGGRVLKMLLLRLVHRTATRLDDEFLEATQREVKWLVALAIVWIATFRLGFLSDRLRTFLSDLYFIVGLAICSLILSKLVDFGVDSFLAGLEEEDKARLGPMVTVLKRMALVVVLLFAASVFFGHFGINITVVAGALGIGGLAFSLAAQDTLADVIAGFTILFDRPFRVGDRIEIPNEGTWGDVVEIGTRTTRIRTRDNRMVIVPNSIIGKSQVVNYTYPDPTYRVEMDIGIGYGQDIEKIRQIIVDTVRQVAGVLPDRPVDALYNEMGESSMTFRVRWWIRSYEDTRRFYDRVNTALQNALDEAGVDMPFSTYDINVKMDEENVGRIAGALGRDSSASSEGE
jgi:MscS family membrane protein